MVFVAQDLNQAIDRIANAVRPWRIVLFGSRARGSHHEDSDYDLYVEVEGSRESRRATRAEIWKLLSDLDLRIDVKVQQVGDIERRRDDPGTIEWDVAREGRVLYAAPGAPINLPPIRRVSEPSPKPPESVHEWLEVAEKDFRHAKLHRDDSEAIDDFSPEICWLSHQTCEKYMKALLVSRHVRPERTHDLKKLLAALRADGCPLPGLDADCAMLTEHAADTRYPAGLDLGPEQGQIAFDAALRIVAAVRAALPPSVH